MTESFDVTRYSQAARALCQAGRFLYQRGWSPATSSNYSSRISECHVAITVSGRHKGQLTEADIMVVDLEEIRYRVTADRRRKPGCIR